MNSAMWRYYTLNQLLLGVDLETLPDAAKEASGVADCRKLLQQVRKIPVEKLDPIENLFLSYLRVEDYGLCVSEASQHVVPLTRVVELVVQNDLDVRQYSPWAAGSLAGVQETGAPTPRITDGILYVPSKHLTEEYDLDGAMRRMFAVRCWGSAAPSKQLKELVRELRNIVSPQGDLILGPDSLAAMLESFLSAKVNPLALSRSVVRIPDLSIVQELTQALCWWTNETKQMVSIICPRGKGDRLVHAVIPVKEFLSLCGDSFTGASGIFVQGDRLVLEGKAI